MKILLHSNGPEVLTGYGIQTAQLARRLKRAGHEVAISAYYGQQGVPGVFDGDIPVLPCAGEAYGNDILHEHAIRWFNGDPLGGWIIPIMDVFGLTSPVLDQFNVAAWTPVDHYPVPPSVRDFFKKTGAHPIAMSRWGEQMLRDSGLDPMYAPLSIESSIFHPIDNARELLGLDADRFVVVMNGMNKGWAIHRKGYPEAFMAFAQFAKEHPDALLYVNAERHGPFAGGISLNDLALYAGVADHNLMFSDQYAYMTGQIPAEFLAALYTAADVLLAPSRGEGFCVPLIEAQACGTPVIVTDFSAQPELVGAGWKVPGEPEWEAAQSGWLIKADIQATINALEQAFAERGSAENRAAAIAKAAEYDADRVFDECWLPILTELDGGTPLVMERPKIPKADGVAVLVPAMNRPYNVAPLIESFRETTTGNDAVLYFVCDADDIAEIRAVEDAGGNVLISTRGSTFAQKANSGYEQTTEPWIFLTGDDVRFHPDWIAAARKLSGRYDVIGTADSPKPGKGNPRVEAGSHADHFFIRRAYIDEYGASLEGMVCHEGYRHFYSDVEVIELAKARGVFTPCLSSLVEHMHPDLGKGEIDDVYKSGWAARDHDAAEWESRRELVEMQRTGRGRVRAA